MLHCAKVSGQQDDICRPMRLGMGPSIMKISKINMFKRNVYLLSPLKQFKGEVSYLTTCLLSHGVSHETSLVNDFNRCHISDPTCCDCYHRTIQLQKDQLGHRRAMNILTLSALQNSDSWLPSIAQSGTPRETYNTMIQN